MTSLEYYTKVTIERNSQGVIILKYYTEEQFIALNVIDKTSECLEMIKLVLPYLKVESNALT